jgi:hypothetical protein
VRIREEEDASSEYGTTVEQQLNASIRDGSYAKGRTRRRIEEFKSLSGLNDSSSIISKSTGALSTTSAHSSSGVKRSGEEGGSKLFDDTGHHRNLNDVTYISIIYDRFLATTSNNCCIDDENYCCFSSSSSSIFCQQFCLDSRRKIRRHQHRSYSPTSTASGGSDNIAS